MLSRLDGPVGDEQRLPPEPGALDLGDGGGAIEAIVTQRGQPIFYARRKERGWDIISHVLAPGFVSVRALVYLQRMNPSPIRKIISLDMEGFYASGAERDNPNVKDRPVAFGYGTRRGGVAAATYGAPASGVRVLAKKDPGRGEADVQFAGMSDQGGVAMESLPIAEFHRVGRTTAAGIHGKGA
jgi:hypothetical protein